ncbi:hypothetical protein RB195_018587 [Necator americanus]|uniref:Uncharacterized protein n=1 Tax=Necator americanus TaxID=51031 RepID=A0ABR1CAF1_NECAM
MLRINSEGPHPSPQLNIKGGNIQRKADRTVHTSDIDIRDMECELALTEKMPNNERGSLAEVTDQLTRIEQTIRNMTPQVTVRGTATEESADAIPTAGPSGQAKAGEAMPTKEDVKVEETSMKTKKKRHFSNSKDQTIKVMQKDLDDLSAPSVIGWASITVTSAQKSRRVRNAEDSSGGTDSVNSASITVIRTGGVGAKTNRAGIAPCIRLQEALQEARIKDRPLISIGNYTINCGDADEKKIPSQQAAIVGIDANAKMRMDINPMCLEMILFHRANIGQWKSSNSPLRVDELHR